MRSTTTIENKIICTSSAATRAQYLLGTERIRTCGMFLRSACNAEAVADVSVAPDDTVLPPYLTSLTNFQMDSNRLKMPGMEVC